MRALDGITRPGPAIVDRRAIYFASAGKSFIVQSGHNFTSWPQRSADPTILAAVATTASSWKAPTISIASGIDPAFGAHFQLEGRSHLQIFLTVFC